MSRDLDIVLFGATGFVGQLTAAYFAEHAPPGARIALGGRNHQKLERVRADLGPRAADWPLVVADSSDPEGLAALARSTTMVATTVGPYAKYGLPLLTACAAEGTHYADLSGEVLFGRRAADEAHATAAASGARIVNCCGFDSVPSDIGVHLLAAHAEQHGLGQLQDTTLVITGISGGLSGGTLDSIRTLVDEIKHDRASRRIVFDPYALSPGRPDEPELRGMRDPLAIRYSPAQGGFLAPFIMGPGNARVVRRSNALSGHRYGRAFRYHEYIAGGRGPLGILKAVGIAAGTVGLLVGFAVPGLRRIVDRLLPSPGEGPSEKTQSRGYFRAEIHAETSSGRRLVCDVHGDGDPGYRATAMMFGQSALALALDELPDVAGVLTPAVAMGDALALRLQNAGQTYTVRNA